MADLLGDGNVKVTFVLTVADTSAPAAAELNAGTDLQEYITKDGLAIEPEQAAVDNTSLASRTETEDAGTTKYSIEFTVKRQDTDLGDVGYNTLAPGQLGYVAIRRNLPHEDAWAAGQAAEVHPVRCGTRRMQPPALNTPQTFVSKLFNHTSGDPDAVVA
jgi:hypothetical protein